MPKATDGQYELVLENRQVMTIFFVGVVLCGVFFGLGYIVGKNAIEHSTAAAAPQASVETKKSAMTGETKEPAAQPGSDLKFYQAVEQKAPDTKLEPAPATPPPAPVSAPAVQPAPVAAQLRTTSTAPVEGTISLQVAALSRREDADTLLSLLRKKSFPANIVTLPGDRLFRVQVGPFTSARDAEDMKVRLEHEGFKAITKK